MQNVDALAASALIAKNRENPNFVILDVRTPAEFKSGKIAGAELLDFYADFATEVSRRDRTKTYFVYCRSGYRSANACAIMEELGFMDCYNLAGGILEWSEAGLPVSH